MRNILLVIAIGLALIIDGHLIYDTAMASKANHNRYAWTNYDYSQGQNTWNQWKKSPFDYTYEREETPVINESWPKGNTGNVYYSPCGTRNNYSNVYQNCQPNYNQNCYEQSNCNQTYYRQSSCNQNYYSQNTCRPFYNRHGFWSYKRGQPVRNVVRFVFGRRCCWR